MTKNAYIKIQALTYHKKLSINQKEKKRYKGWPILQQRRDFWFGQEPIIFPELFYGRFDQVLQSFTCILYCITIEMHVSYDPYNINKEEI